MSVRLEWARARDSRPTVHRRGERLGDGQTVEGDVALVIGTQVVEGTYEEVRERVIEALAELQRSKRSKRGAR